MNGMQILLTTIVDQIEVGRKIII